MKNILNIFYVILIKKFIYILLNEKFFILNTNYLLISTYIIFKYINFINLKIITVIIYLISTFYNNSVFINIISIFIPLIIFFNDIIKFKNLYYINKKIILIKFSFMSHIIKLFILYILNLYGFITLNLLLKILMYSILNSFYIFILI